MFVFFEASPQPPLQTNSKSSITPTTDVKTQPAVTTPSSQLDQTPQQQNTNTTTTTATPAADTQNSNSAAEQTTTPVTPEKPEEQKSDRLSRLAKNVALVGGGIGIGALAHGLFGHGSEDMGDTGHGSSSAAAMLNVNHDDHVSHDAPKVAEVHHDAPVSRTVAPVTHNTTNIYNYHQAPQYDDHPRVFRQHFPSSSLQPGHRSIMIGDGFPRSGVGWNSGYYHRVTPFDMVHSRMPRIGGPMMFGYRRW